MIFPGLKKSQQERGRQLSSHAFSEKHSCFAMVKWLLLLWVALLLETSIVMPLLHYQDDLSLSHAGPLQLQTANFRKVPQLSNLLLKRQRQTHAPSQNKMEAIIIPPLKEKMLVGRLQHDSHIPWFNAHYRLAT